MAQPWHQYANQGSMIGRRMLNRAGTISIVVFLFLVASWHLHSGYRSPASYHTANTGRLHAQSAFAPPHDRLPSLSNALTLTLPEDSTKRWSAVLDVFNRHNPGDPLHAQYDHLDKTINWWENKDTYTRLDLLTLQPEQIAVAKAAHAGFLKELPMLAKNFTYAKHSRGIVTTAGGGQLPVLLISLQLLRQTGCTLPIEVFILSLQEYEPVICETVLPAFNAKCVLLGNTLLPGQSQLQAWQAKALIILMSSFTELLYLDADSFPVLDPTAFFDVDPYKSTGLVIWPDFWLATQSRLYYEISDQAVPDARERAASESGQMLYDKSRHTRDLLLACYYGYYGPGLYFKLLSQGVAGEGDKEAFLAAALALGAPVYTPQQPPQKVPRVVEGDFSIEQVDPVADWAVVRTGRNWAQQFSRPAFLHAHHPRLNAGRMFENGLPEQPKRLWGPKEEMVQIYGFDVELDMWHAANYTACELEGMFADWHGKASVCHHIMNFIRQVFAV